MLSLRTAAQIRKREGNQMSEQNDPDDPKVPTEQPSFSSTEDDPLATAGTGGSEEPQGRVRPGGGDEAPEPHEPDEEQARQEKLGRTR